MLRLMSGWIAAVVVCAAPALAGETASPPSDAQIAGWIRDLDAEQYAAREAASEKLVSAGRAAIAPLAKAILSDSPEAAWRASDVLEQIGISGDEKTLELVSQAMAEISKSGKPSLAKSTSEVQRRWKLLRQERAIAQIAKLGGQVRTADGEMFAFGGGFGGIMPAVDLDVMPAVEVWEVEEAEAAEDVPLDLKKEIDRIVIEKLKDLELKAVPADAPRIEAGEDPFDLLPLPRAKAERALPDIDLPFGGKIEFLPGPLPGPAKGPPPAAGDALEDVPEAPRGIEERPAPKGFFGKIFRALGDVFPKEPPAEFEPLDVERIFRAEPVEEMELVPDVVEFAEVAMGVDFESFGDDGEGAHAVRLGKEWKGGADGLKLLKDVMQLSSLEIHELDLTAAHFDHLSQLPDLRQLNLQRCRFDRAAVAKLKKVKPDLTVLTYGEAIMGMSGEAQGEGFHVSFVAPGSGAHAAGLLSDDVVTRLSGEELRSFEQLTHIVASHKIGDKLGVDVLRQGKKLSLEVTLKAREPGN